MAIQMTENFWKYLALSLSLSKKNTDMIVDLYRKYNSQMKTINLKKWGVDRNGLQETKV